MYLKAIVVCAWDTDVILLLLHHYQRFKCDEVWVMAGTSAKRKFIPIHTIALSMEDQIRKNILAFHAITGCCPFRMLQSVIIVMGNSFHRRGRKRVYRVCKNKVNIMAAPDCDKIK